MSSITRPSRREEEIEPECIPKVWDDAAARDQQPRGRPRSRSSEQAQKAARPAARDWDPRFPRISVRYSQLEANRFHRPASGDGGRGYTPGLVIRLLGDRQVDRLGVGDRGPRLEACLRPD